MKTAILLAVAIVILSSLPFVSRQANVAAQEATGTHAVATQTNSSTAATAAAQIGSVRVRSELPDKLNKKQSISASAKAADAIVENAKEKLKTVSSSSRQ